MKKNLYERPSLEVVVLEHKEMLMTSGNKEEVNRTDYGNPITQDWSRKCDWEEEEWEEEEE